MENIEKRKIKLIIFDVDGVLLDNKLGGFKDILFALGKESEVKIIDAEYQRRKHLGPWGLEELANLYKGFSLEKLSNLSSEYCEKNLVIGAEETIAALREKEYMIGAISSNPQFIMDTLKTMLFLDFAIGTALEIEKGIATGKIARKVDRYKKAEVLEEKMRELDISGEKVVVVGDSLTDLQIAKRAGFFIAFNAKEEIIAKADAVVRQKDLRGILPFLAK